MAEKTATLSERLWELANAILARVKEYREQGGLVSMRSWYVKPVVSNFEYKEGGTSFQTSFQNVEKEEWHWRDQHEFIEKAIKPLPAYVSSLATIVDRYAIAREQADFWLVRFAQLLASRATEAVSDGFLVDKVTTFINDLEKTPVDWEVVAWLDGIWLEDDAYDLPGKMLLRRPKPADIEVERQIDVLPFGSPFGLQFLPSAVLELQLRGREGVEIQRDLESILHVLRLYRLGSITASKVRLNPKSFVSFGGVLGPGRHVGAAHKYKFTKDDVKLFTELLAKLRPVLPVPFIESGDIDPVTIAFQRYQEALLQPVAFESRITSAITCLEALYLKAEERMELSHRLGQRAAALLGLFGQNALEVYKSLVRAYEVRSVFIHGSQIEKNQQQALPKVSETVMEYARLSLVIFFQLKQLMDKERLLNKLDNSLLDGNAQAKLRETVTKDILVS